MGVEERTDEEQLFGSIMVPHVSTAAANCLPCVDQCDDVETGEEDGVKRGVNEVLVDNRAGDDVPLTSSISYSTDRTPSLEHVKALTCALMTH